jgi:putative membrane protein
VDFYPYVKAFHIISIIAWMAGILYLPRLFVYHTQAATGSELSETLKVMERRLLKAIINPAMAAAWILGMILVFWYGVIDWSADFWFHAKLTLVILLSGFHGALSRWQKDFQADRNTRSQRFYRIANEVPTVIMIIVVLLVVVRPF